MKMTAKRKGLLELVSELGATADVPPLALLVSGGLTVSLLSVQILTSADPIGRCILFWKQLRGQEKKLSCSGSVKSGIDNYSDLHRSDNHDAESRSTMYKDLVNSYYDLATVFYEWGWGPCFHFAAQYPHETFWESIRRHEYFLASKLGLPKISSSHRIENGENSTEDKRSSSVAANTKILDVGCGIGGPMRNIARFTGSHVVGITLNPYQVGRGNELNNLDPSIRGKCKSVQGDFMDTKFESESFDAAYAIEATCHAPDRVKCYAEVNRVLKPGGIFACYEWCMTDKFDASNAEHLRMKKDIEEGNGLPDIVNTKVCLKALEEAGFEILEEFDLAEVPGVKPWYTPLMPSWNPLSQRFQFNPVGSVITNFSIYAMEFLRIAPKGTVKTQKILQAGGFALRDAGDEKIFTAMYLMVGRKKG